MRTLDIDEAKTPLSTWIAWVAASPQREIVITQNGRPAARLVPWCAASQPGRRIAVAKGQFQMPADIDTSVEEAAALFTAGKDPAARKRHAL